MKGFTSLSLVLAFAACSRKETPPPAPPPAPAAQLTTDPDPGVPGSQNLAPLARLAPVMSREAQQRPAVRVTADHVFAALTTAGVELKTTKQVLATTANAAYCALGVTPDNIAVAVCEYPSPANAKAGLAMLDSRYRKLVPDAVRKVNGNTLITVANASSHKDVRDKVLGVFMSL